MKSFRTYPWLTSVLLHAMMVGMVMAATLPAWVEYRESRGSSLKQAAWYYPRPRLSEEEIRVEEQVEPVPDRMDESDAVDEEVSAATTAELDAMPASSAPVELGPLTGMLPAASGVSLAAASTANPTAAAPADAHPADAKPPRQAIAASAPPPPSAGDSPASIQHYVKPVYPSIARRRGWEGTVVVDVSIDAAGGMTAATVVESSGRAVLDDAALAALRRCRYAPAQAGGLPVASVKRIRVTFALEE